MFNCRMGDRRRYLGNWASRSPSNWCPFSPLFWVGRETPYQNRLQKKKDALILSSLLEDLGLVFFERSILT